MSEIRIARTAFVSIALIASLSFALGYMWGHGGSVAPIVIEKCSDA